MAIVEGTGGSDALLGSDGADALYGLEGDDGILALEGDDLLDGGTGNDTLAGGDGNDIYVVDAGGDVVVENAGEGRDTVLTALPTYTLGANVEDLTFTGIGGFTGLGNALDNVITGGGGDDILVGDLGNDTLIGDGGDDILIGGAGNDRMEGGIGADTLIGGAGDDVFVVDTLADAILETSGTDTVETTLTGYVLADGIENLHYTGSAAFTGTGNALDNILTGAGGNDALFGGAGNDRLDGGAGADTLDGGTGNDTYVVDDAGDLVSEAAGAGVDTVETTLAAYTLGSEVERLVFTGTGDFRGTGNALDNTLIGGDGNDRLSGGAGNDTLAGGAGDDTYIVDSLGDVTVEVEGAGTDGVRTSLATYTLADNIENLRYTGSRSFTGTGNALDNSITGGAGADTLFGADGNDKLDGAAGDDTLVGGTGDDTYIVDSLGDIVSEAEGAGSDRVITTLGAYTLADHVEGLYYAGSGDFAGTGNALDNRIVGGSGNDVLNGMDGNDRLDGRAGDDTLAGGLGDDTYIIDSPGDVVVELDGEGLDTIRTTLAAYTLADNVENLAYAGTGDFAGTGNALDNSITGGTGNDTLSGADGNDKLDGGAGDDRLAGGTGNDTYIVDSTGDVVSEAEGEGFDRVVTSLSAYTLGANVEGLAHSGSGDFTGTGNALDNRLMGGAGNDTLFGGEGNDRLDGGAGDDTLAGGTGNDSYLVDSLGDVVIEAAGEGSDTIRTSLATYTLADNVENLAYAGTDAFTGTGNALDNSITGGDGEDMLFGAEGNDKLNGGAGDDTLVGGIGDDTYVIDSAGDLVVEAAGEGWDRVSTSLDSYTLGDEVEGLAYSGTGDFTGTGNSLANRIAGGIGNDTLFGLEGDDRLDGGDGDDSLQGGLGWDRLTGGAGADTFVYTDVGQSSLANGYDVISDFDAASGDLIDLSGIDADSTGGTDNDAFVYIGTGDFSGTAGELRFSNGTLEGDTNGDGSADLTVKLSNTSSLGTANIAL